MKSSIISDYSLLDQPEILRVLFHPREESEISGHEAGVHTVRIPVTDHITIGARFHMSGKAYPNILFFHGNGEIVSDYDDLGPIYNQYAINFLVVDYRGYGISSGVPTVSAMMMDCHIIFNFVRHWLDENGFNGPFLIMGRSLGSASALELAAFHESEIAGLIIESGFAYIGPLLSLLGVSSECIDKVEKTGFRHIEKIGSFGKPTLIIHGQLDQIISYSQGRKLYEASGSANKRLLKIPGAGHNDIFARALSEYMGAIAALTACLLSINDGSH